MYTVLECIVPKRHIRTYYGIEQRSRSLLHNFSFRPSVALVMEKIQHFILIVSGKYLVRVSRPLQLRIYHQNARKDSTTLTGTNEKFQNHTYVFDKVTKNPQTIQF